MARSPDLCISLEFTPEWYPGGGAKRFLEEIEGYGFKIRRIGANAQLLAPSHDELVRTPHNDLLLVPGDLEI